jgi:RNA polymerase sigma factor (sigma-70 family)
MTDECVPPAGVTEFLQSHDDQIQKIVRKFRNEYGFDEHTEADFAQEARKDLSKAFTRQIREKLESVSYVNSIIANAIKQALKKWILVQDREEPIETERRTDSGRELIPRTDDPALFVSDPEDAYIRRIDEERLRQLRSVLPAFQQKILRLRIENGLTLKQTASVLGSSTSTVQRHEKLATETLKKNIGKKSEIRTSYKVSPSACCPVKTRPTLDKQGGEHSPPEPSFGVHFPDSDQYRVTPDVPLAGTNTNLRLTESPSVIGSDISPAAPC